MYSAHLANVKARHVTMHIEDLQYMLEYSAHLATDKVRAGSMHNDDVQYIDVNSTYLVTAKFRDVSTHDEDVQYIRCTRLTSRPSRLASSACTTKISIMFGVFGVLR